MTRNQQHRLFRCVLLLRRQKRRKRVRVRPVTQRARLVIVPRLRLPGRIRGQIAAEVAALADKTTLLMRMETTECDSIVRINAHEAKTVVDLACTKIMEE